LFLSHHRRPRAPSTLCRYTALSPSFGIAGSGFLLRRDASKITQEADELIHTKIIRISQPSLFLPCGTLAWHDKSLFFFFCVSACCISVFRYDNEIQIGIGIRLAEILSDVSDYISITSVPFCSPILAIKLNQIKSAYPKESKDILRISRPTATPTNP